MSQKEIDNGSDYIGYTEALSLIQNNIKPAGIKRQLLAACPGYITAEKVVALVNSPTSDVSLKDGFAVKVEDVSAASSLHPVILEVVGSVFAGGQFKGSVARGQAVKICSGSPLPAGSDAVLSAEFCEERPPWVLIKECENEGKNIFRAGADVRAGTVILDEGQMLLPARLGLAAAAGISHIKVYQKPCVSLIAIGDEVVPPGEELKEGQLYASNAVNIASWLACLKIPYTTSVTGDNREAIRHELVKFISTSDAIITSGGAWGSERDLIVSVLDELGWEKIFNHVRLGPGKGVAFGMWEGKPVMCLPGGPPSNEMAFLQLALPGMYRLAGHNTPPLIKIPARLSENLKRRHIAWTEFKKARLVREADGSFSVTPFFEVSRLKHMADSECLICVPEGIESLYQGQVIHVQLMVPAFVSDFT
jgi:molybdopterin molybdotransferase